MKKIKISIIIPCYNGWQYMNNCLKSLENQTVKPFEVVICDDCSTDDSVKNLSDYIKSSSLKIKLIQNEKNVGPGVSRDNAIKNSTGDYLAFCDCDDWYEESFIEQMTNAISSNKCDLVICDNYITYDDRKTVCHATQNLVGAKKEKIIALYKMSLCRLVAKKELFLDIKTPRIYHGEDAAIVPQVMARADNIAVVDVPLYNYYFRENSSSNKNSKSAHIDMIKGFKAVEKIKKRYHKECEFLGIKMVLYGATLNAFKAKIKTKEIAKTVKEFTNKYPDWQKNEYLKEYSKTKRIYLKFLSFKAYFICKIMASFHHVIVKNKKGD